MQEPQKKLSSRLIDPQSNFLYQHYARNKRFMHRRILIRNVYPPGLFFNRLDLLSIAHFSGDASREISSIDTEDSQSKEMETREVRRATRFALRVLSRRIQLKPNATMT